MFLTMLSLLLLVSMVMWVINLGEQVNRRQTTQFAADSAAQSAAGWAARLINMISANNEDMTRTVALISTMDALPQATEFTTTEMQKFHESLQGQMGRGIPEPNAQLQALVVEMFSQLQSSFEDDLDQLEPVDQVFKERDISEMTFYAQDGSLWNSLYTADLVNQALVDNYGQEVQLAADAGGRRNFRTGTGGITLLPASPVLPHERGQFHDYRRPVLNGLLPVKRDDKIEARGPWDTIYGWRRIHTERVLVGGMSSTSPVQTSAPIQLTFRASAASGRGHTPISRGAGARRRPPPPGPPTPSAPSPYRNVPVAYSTWGWHDELIRMVGGKTFNHARFQTWYRSIADHKLNYLWPGVKPEAKVYEPDWRIDLNEARQIAAAGTPQIRETLFFAVEIMSRYPKGSGNFLEPGSWVTRNANYGARLNYLRGFHDPGTWGPPSKQLNDWLWSDEWGFETWYEPRIGIDLDDTQQPAPVYMYDFFIFAGVNVGPEADIRNPFQGFNPDSEDAPAPMLLDPQVLPASSYEAKWDHLKFLAVARQHDTPQAWGSRFRGGRPYPNIVAIAQARTFNDHSWDYWTQMWKAELEPVTNRDGSVGLMDWAEAMSQSRADDGPDLALFLRSLTVVAPEILGH